MISTTLHDTNTVLELTNRRSSKSVSNSCVRRKKRTRNWTLLLVFLVSPAIMFCIGIVGLVALLN
ncbi:hypothetical protein NOF55_10795 [Rhizobiaceae bacterium BDR2-2]|uniref:Uncharacterized protein n=1 Tax=Ectorhizobium quercum TaxID=2965071 RepID=A0AAE3MZ42_9HYPH|nr:hypothetical protein [Ectorhizobium quercum]MCX8997594.1 hypothetical protein [Ectorhizobium quercum]